MKRHGVGPGISFGKCAVAQAQLLIVEKVPELSRDLSEYVLSLNRIIHKYHSDHIFNITIIYMFQVRALLRLGF
jgi:hypothetical protein